MTRPGVILGTAAYMSPEQARGQVVDKRTDIWAFGCVLFEMLTGHLAFNGDTVSDTIVAILERRAGMGRAPGRDAGRRSRVAATVPGEGSEAPFAGYRRRANRARTTASAGPAELRTVADVGTVRDVRSCTGAGSRLIGAGARAARQAVRAVLLDETLACP